MDKTDSVQQWRFPSNQHGEIKGINDAGVQTFGADTFKSLVRESIQNSLDAAMKGNTVTVDFKLFEIMPSEFPGFKDFQDILRRCEKGSNKNDIAISFFKNAQRNFSNPFQVLQISDFGTTGLTGAETGLQGSQWSQLIKESGSSNKSVESGGSFGIGKYASYACSDFRTVFFSSVACDGVESSIGVARLVSFNDSNNQLTTGIGYYSDNEQNLAIQNQLQLPHAKIREATNPGTDLYIMGLKQVDRLLESIINDVLTDYLVAIWKEQLIVNVGEVAINKGTLAHLIGNLNPHENPVLRETIEYYDLLTATDDAIHIIPLHPEVDGYGKRYGYLDGECHLYLKEGEGLNKRVMMTRPSGMKLFLQSHINRSISFTGILMISGKKMSKDFREMEAPSHDSWDPGRAPDPKKAKQNYSELRAWIRDKVRECFETPPDEQIDAYGAGFYLPADEHEGDQQAKSTPLENLVTENIRFKKRELTIRERSSARSSASVMPGGDGAEVRIGTSEGKKGGRQGGKQGGDDEGYTFVPLRGRAICLKPEEGKYKIKIVIPRDANFSKLLFHSQGEGGSERLDILHASVVSGPVTITKIKENTVFFTGGKQSDIVEIEYIVDFDRYCMMGANYYEG